MNGKYCSKKGHHEGRLIQALCLNPQCKNDRLLCFYCKHQTHRQHETAYFPKGLPASLETFNKNSCLQNAEKEKKKIEKKLKSIKKGWQSIQKITNDHLRIMQKSIKQSYETIQSTFSSDSVQKIKVKLSTEVIPPQQVEKYVDMINKVSTFHLNDKQKVLMYAKLKERVLEDVFDRTAMEVKNLLQNVERNSKELNFSSNQLNLYAEKFFQEQNDQLKNDQLRIFFQDNEEVMQFKKKFQTEFYDTESEFSSNIDLNENHQIIGLDSEQNTHNSQPSIKQENVQICLNNPETASNHNFRNNQDSSPYQSPKKFRIKIGKNSIQEVNIEANQQFPSLLEESPINQTSLKTDRLQYRYILKLKNNLLTEDRRNFSQEKQITCIRTIPMAENQQDSIKSIEKTKKKVKPNENENQVKKTQLQDKRFKQKMLGIFGNFEQSSSNSSSNIQESENKKKKDKQKPLIMTSLTQNRLDQTSKILQKLNKPKRILQESYGTFDFSQFTKRESLAPTSVPPPVIYVQEQTKTPTASSMVSQQEEFIEIERKIIKLPQSNSSNPSKSHLIYPYAKVYGHNLWQIYDGLKMIQPEVVTKLQVYCDTTTLCVDKECIDVICQMKQLKSLMIYMTYQMSKKDVKKIVKSLPQLQELVLCQFNNMDVELAKIIREHLPKLKRFFYSVDYKNYMQKMQENLQFFVDISTPSTIYEVVKVLSDIPTLETIQLINLDRKTAARIPTLLKKMPNLKQLCIVNSTNIQSNSVQIIEYLSSEVDALTVFCAQNTYFKEQSFTKMIKRNPGLQTLIINECLQFKNETIQVLSESCKHLEQLSLMLTDSIHGKDIYDLKELRTLILRGCWKIDQDEFLKNLHKLNKLEYLSVSYNNYWFYDHLMNEVVKLSKLKFLNLDTTKVTDSGIKDLHKLSQLQTLICGKTQLTFQQLIKALKNPETGLKNYNIRKLGLSKDQSYTKEVNSKSYKNKHDISITEFHAKHLLALGKALPALTHLSIGGFIDPRKEYFKTLTNLKCLAVAKKQLETETEDWLVSKGVYINEDY